MSKIGLELSIDVKQIDKARLYQGKKGTYLNLTTFVELDEADQYGNHGFITQKKNKGEEGKMPILGNVKIFWKEADQQDQGGGQGENYDPKSDDIPF